MTITPVTNEKIAETSSKGNQEKWYDSSINKWYKLDQFGYESLAETFISMLLEKSNIESSTPFTFVRYDMEKLLVRGVERIGCVSNNFLQPGQSLITVNRLLTSRLGVPLKQKLIELSSVKRRIAYLAEAIAEYTGLSEFPQYLTLLFEIDSLFCNDDRHLNNIAVIEKEGRYNYCPIFDNAAGLLSDIELARMNIEPKALVSALKARPFNVSFTRQMNSVRSLYKQQLAMPKLTPKDLRSMLTPLLPYYDELVQGIISDRVTGSIMLRSKAL